MVPSNLGYSLREAGHHFRRNWTTVLGAIVTIFLSLFIIGLFVLGSVMISSVVGGVEDSVTIQAYLSDDASDSAVESLQSKIEGWDNVESVTYKSKDEALEDYRTSMSNRNASDAVAALDGENPLPASLVITLTDPQEVAATAERIMDDSSFLQIRDTADDPESSPADDVVYGQGTVDRLFEVTNYIRLGAVALVIMLTSWRSSSSTTRFASPSPRVGVRSPSCVSSAPPTASSAGRSSPRACSSRSSRPFSPSRRSRAACTS